MKMLIVLILISCTCQAQKIDPPPVKPTAQWRMNNNKWITGGLVFIAGSAKGFNETLVFHYKVFRKKFPNANHQWYDPKLSWRNKYKNRDPNQSSKFAMSTSAFIFTTDQYHLNNFIGRSAILTAIVIKIGEKKKPFKYYMYDLLYYTACFQAGFALTYYPFASWTQNK